MIQILKCDKNPISFMGKVAGVCWGANIDNKSANFKRGLECIENNHGRVEEFADITLILDEYSARVFRELYTHIIGTSRLQESTRYVDCSDFGYYTPNSIDNNSEAKSLYDSCMDNIKSTYKALLGLGISKEDIGNILPLGSNSKMVLKINIRALLHLFEMRTCNRTYKEFRKLMNDLKTELSQIDSEWKLLCDKYFKPKCVKMLYCDERYSCGLMPKKKDIIDIISSSNNTK